jgi:hypothetical protein
MLEDMPDRISEQMSDRMLGKMSKHMSEYMTLNARGGITRSKVITNFPGFFTIFSWHFGDVLQLLPLKIPNPASFGGASAPPCQIKTWAPASRNGI